MYAIPAACACAIDNRSGWHLAHNKFKTVVPSFISLPGTVLIVLIVLIVLLTSARQDKKTSTTTKLKTRAC